MQDGSFHFRRNKVLTNAIFSGTDSFALISYQEVCSTGGCLFENKKTYDVSTASRHVKRLNIISSWPDGTLPKTF